MRETGIIPGACDVTSVQDTLSFMIHALDLRLVRTISLERKEV